MKDTFLGLKESELIRLFAVLDHKIDTLLKNNIFPCILLSGDLGTGKTTFVRKWMHHRGSSDLVNSPTFALQNEYELNGQPVHHFDLYRLKSAEELEELGFSEIWGKEGISFIEWWKIADSFLPEQGRIYLQIFHSDFESRDYELKTDSE
ncbi:tRNA (adenosine(37)-N6)-threonylcarbamoyltransferase complex ATPase subunit type 1 TsaE [Leptospira idonii]|uniref:tRNA threonylcarbamoyladenosine biosynthesis protein TsaE n=1 Tax=Leptospira idonii TaxID=1193500 RepID=A0A4R9M2X2_9LEPT|nr:tRNA (adenosine(37)-N6)-threonylcarbamoyltransferase complex ATPase subunit type 1 TsaE [Leptospira idonii]TGN20341.1 tRNA (adenosine(37)-N6)-threonylcarbamoyltransferase complex ATPase subunit type 1 TsaE [Leptospira idonii]